MTVESLLSGAKPDLPPLAIEAGFKRAEKEDRADQNQGSLLDLGGLEAPTMARTRQSRGGQGKRATV